MKHAMNRHYYSEVKKLSDKYIANNLYVYKHNFKLKLNAKYFDWH